MFDKLRRNAIKCWNNQNKVLAITAMMDAFLREYAARSITKHFSLPQHSSLGYLPQNDSINDVNYFDEAEQDNFYIQPQQQLLNNENLTEAAANSSNNGTMQVLVSLAAALVSSNHEALKTYNESFRDASSPETTYQNLTCDGESLSAESAEIAEESPLSSVYFKTAVYLLYIPIFVFAVLGNGTVCYIVQSTPRMRTVTNYFIANLAVGDIVMTLFCVPFTFVSIFVLGYWPFGIAVCYLVNYSQAVSVLVSAYTLVAISIDRYIAIMWPLRPRITKR